MQLRLLLFLLTFITSKSLYSQEYFSGEIHYKTSYTDLSKRDLTDSIVKLSRQNNNYTKENLIESWYMNERNIKNTNADGIANLIYLREKNKVYRLINGIYITKTIYPTDSEYEVKHLDLIDTIAGYPCKAVVLENFNAMHIIYYNDSIKIPLKVNKKLLNVIQFKALNFTNGAFPLSIVSSKSRKYFQITEAISIIHRELLDEEFSISKKK